MSGCPITINNVSGNGVVNVGGAISISPLTASKTVFGSGGGNIGIVIQNNAVSQSKMFEHQFSDQNIVKSI
ncbi:spore germination protein [Bacillus siamensis]|uniref:spore germination protein n=1 Tax=Bacillus TaxID=1386 RepID=UPI0002FA7B58|nr:MULTISPECIES: spore germination protein [Bacillus]MBD0407846.1 spore germination protein [Bacillus sp. 1021]MDU0811561.1 spore germination protein [Bacillus siamensis]MED5049545.1 spore germination protein [Bacillus siamensis]MED5097945.1 spore germination protein [Bacillus siamensis]OAZ69585.1 Spore germination protein-like protein YpzD [Bacillus siamensis]